MTVPYLKTKIEDQEFRASLGYLASSRLAGSRKHSVSSKQIF